jgi:hypothetical protein
MRLTRITWVSVILPALLSGAAAWAAPPDEDPEIPAARAPAPKASAQKKGGPILQPYGPGYHAPAQGVLHPYPPSGQILQPYPPGYRPPAAPPPGQLLYPYPPGFNYAAPAVPAYPPGYGYGYPYPQQQQQPQYYYPYPYQYPQQPQYHYPQAQPQYQYPQPQPQYQYPYPYPYQYPYPYPYPPPYQYPYGYQPQHPPPQYQQMPQSEAVAPAPAPASYTPPARQQKSKNRLLAKLWLGYSYRYGLDDSMHAGAIEAMLGGEGSHFGVGGRVGLEAGRTASGLRFTILTAGPGLEWKLGSRFRLGFSPTLGVLIFDRATRSDDEMWTMMFGTHIDLSVDLVKRKSGGGLFLAGRIGYDFVFAVRNLSDSMLNTRLWVGYRF